MDSSPSLPYPPRKSSLTSPPQTQTSNRSTRPANLNFGSLLSFGQQQAASNGPLKRKPLPPDSPALLANKFGASEHDQKLNPPPTAASSATSSPLLVRDLDQFPRGQSPLLASRSLHRKPINGGKEAGPSNRSSQSPLSSPHRSRGLSAPSGWLPKISEQEKGMRRQRPQASHPVSHSPLPAMNFSDQIPSHESTDSKQPRTPGSKITQFFNWRRTTSPEGDDSSGTEPSDHGVSPGPSPAATSPQTSRYSARSFPHGMDSYKPDTGRGGDFASPLIHPSLVNHDLADTVDQLEGELREISCELAGSIKREMELEDLVERLQGEAVGPNDETRTSDYYSDSSTGSARLAVLEASLKLEDFEKVKRQSEQERAQLKVDFSHKWQEEIGRRRVLETHVRSLESQIAEGRAGHVDASRLSAKHQELEASLEDARKGLAGEREIKETFEARLNGLRTQVESDRTERNRLRDEVVPQLQAKLLSKNIEPAPPRFDFARMQQDIQALKNENAALKEARKMQHDMQPPSARFNVISEEDESPTCLSPRSPPIGVGRTNSVVRASARSPGLARSGSLSRSNSTGGKSPIEPRETLVDRMKDVEFQRDALHSAMKALLARQECQSKEYEKQIRGLEQERDRAALPPTPRRLGYEKEVRNLRGEINQLRRRADEALTQKLQCEKGLGGLKMDLDRSEAETSTLRRLVKEHDIALPDESSDSLQHAYNDLQQDRLDAAAFMKEDPSSRSVEEEQRLAEQLRQSAERSEGLARQMSEQLATNQALRDRLAHAIGRGERNQVTSTGQITELETKLGVLEETVSAAQQKSEAGMAAHEEEIRILEEAHKAQLRRLGAGGYRSPTSGEASGRRGLSPLVSPIFSQRTPRLDQTSSGQGMRLDQAIKTQQLEKKVAELEAALEGTDREMQEVVSRMNVAQIEVMQLQTERDEVLNASRKLETAIAGERERVRSLIKRTKAG